MSKRGFIAAPLVLLVAYAVGCVLTHGSAMFVYSSVAAAKLLGGLGLALAAARYGRREYLFWAWAMLSANMWLLGAAELLFTSRFNLAGLSPEAADRGWAGLIVVANIIAATGTIMLARVWRVVGLALPDSSGNRRLVVIGGIVVSAAIIVYMTIPYWKLMLAGKPDGFVGVAGAMSDLVCFSVIAPLALRALALRGGTLAWPWGLIAANSLAWMIFDVTVELNVPLSEVTARTVVNGVRIAACLLAMAAGLAQRWAIRAGGARAALERA